MQIKMFIEHPERKPKPTFDMELGNKHHREVAASLKGINFFIFITPKSYEFIFT